ncbi:hypothetical protein LTR51_005050 [Lithohypha guttulata]|uniref:Uncharacterized protein n=1 Tax=Lithohypha guttulata TaxID=1690604 RepID=A0AAN7T405_9EURO|nr:hypothetical protein LTR51_005050 [Lithohypha guttulata]KAK5087799.1 hypothetical protein LTR05_002014 [Lithohypha guttulata]
MKKVTLSQSKWAPSSARNVSEHPHHPVNGTYSEAGTRIASLEKRHNARLQSYQKFLKSFRRLKWKSTTLLFCHHRALLQETNNVINNTNFPISSDTGKANAAEIMFKVDFFEWYALLERVLVSLLGCYETVPLPPTENATNPNEQSTIHKTEDSIIGDSVAFHGYAHRFHANVLAAFDQPSNPLRHVLGEGMVRQYLGIAKEFRNRWKEIELEHVDHESQLASMHKSYRQILTDLKLEDLLAMILSALGQSEAQTAIHLAAAHGSREVNMINADDDDGAYNVDEVGDLMDWD